MCPLCGGRGLFRVEYPDPPADVVLCVCVAGQKARQPGRAWVDVRAMLAARFKVTLDQVQLAEEALDDEDWPDGMQPGRGAGRTGDFQQAGKTQKARL